MADNTNYGDFIRGIDRLTSEQKEVLYERLKAELSKPRQNGIEYENAEVISASKDTVKIIRPRVLGDKPRSSVECCLHCGSIAIKKYGLTKGGVQRYRCKDCKKTFSENYGLITHYTHLSEWQWKEIIRGLVEGLSLTEISKNISTSVGTVWSCRMKVYQSIQNIYADYDSFNNIVEADGKYERVSFKGHKDKTFFIDKLGRLPRHHRSRKERIEYLADDYNNLFKCNPHLLKEMIYSSNKRMVGRDTVDINHQHLCVLTAVDRNNSLFVKPVTSGTPTSHDIDRWLADRITSDAILVTDECHSYKYLCRKNRIRHEVIESNTYVNGTFSLSRVNSIHSSMDRFFRSKEYYPATKYIDLYLMMFWWLEKNKDISSNDLVSKLYLIMTGYVSSETRKKMKRITVKELCNRKLPIDTKGYYI